VKKFFIIQFVTFIFYSANAQIANIFADQFPDSAKTRVGIVGDYDLNSNSLTNAFLTKFYTGGYINDDLKNSVLDRVKNQNRVGADLNYGVYAAFKLDSLFHKKNLSLFFGVHNREHFDASFSKDLYTVGFYGNSQYAGKTANFDNFNLNFIKYQQIQIGIFSSKLDSAARWGIGVSFLTGEQYATILAKKAELFTSADGQYINFNTSMEVAQSDTAHKSLGAFNGYGASVDIYFEAPFKTRFGNSKLRVSVADIGVIQFNKKSLYLNQDSLFHYSGITVNSIYDLQSSSLGHTTKDSIIKNIAPFKKQSFSVTLPAVFNLSFETQFNKRFLLTEGIRYIYNANYSLFAYLKGNFYITKKFMLSATFGYGGYGTFNYGLGVFANIYKGFIVYAGCNNVDGYIVPNKSSGQGAYISLIKNFK
jgi:hypothetical protein